MKLALDLHVHTNHSPCGLMPAHKLEMIALKKGLSGVAVTDHNTIEGALELAACAKRLKVIVGEEIRTTAGEIIGYFLQETIPASLSVKETIAEIRRQGGLISIPHPFDRLRKSRIATEALAQVLADIDMLEKFNGRDIFQKPDQQLLEQARKSGVHLIVGSDAHQGIEVGRCRVIMEDFKTAQEFLRNMKVAQFITKKNPLWVHLITKLMKHFKKPQSTST